MLYVCTLPSRVTKKNVCNFHPGQRIDQFNTRLLIFSTILSPSLLLFPFHRGDTSLRLNDRNMLMRGGHLEGGKLEESWRRKFDELEIYIYIYIPVAFSFRILFRSGKSLILARGSKYRKVDIIVVRVLFGKIDLFGIFILERLICGI